MADSPDTTAVPKIPLNDPTASTEIVLPARTIYLGDLMDRALDKLRTAHLALTPENETWRDTETMGAIWATIEQVIRDLEPVRNRLQGVEGGEQ